MSEPIPSPPKPLTKAGYLLRTTYWAFLTPGAVLVAPLALIATLAEGMSMIPYMYNAFEFFLGACAFVFSAFLVYLGVRYWRNLDKKLRDGQVPGSFTLWILPFWIPLFWGLAVSSVGLYVASVLSDFNVGVRATLIGFPQHFIFHAALAGINGKIGLFVAAAGIVSFVVAVVGTTTISRISPPVRKLRGILLCSVTTLLLCGLVGSSYRCFQAEVLYPFFGYSPLNNRNLYGSGSLSDSGSDTDLSEYFPFDENNKLVKIESPTLAIASNHPRIHGAFALYPIYAAAVEAIYRNTEHLKFGKYGYIYDSYEHVTPMAGTSPQAFESLLARKSDMVFMLQPSEKQFQQAKDAGCELVITPIGYEAFVFFVSTVNPVDGLSLNQIRDIYSKKIVRWNSVGGKNERILAFQRPEGSGSQTAMLRVMGDVPIALPLPGEFRKGMGGIVESVADYRNYGNSIGFSFRYYVEGLFKHEGVKLLKIDGVAPTIENIQNDSYPLIGELVIISRADNINPQVQKLTRWFLSPQGQELIKNVGYVPLKQE